ncbi:hypothetical protein GH741_03550 [Aquibacillus halophilus]|uniref:Nucleotidyl transferase AbiEii/AbiGii toxin family protein n=1 Tax=Aquibacillus halophilus TaxID=930132 RepID=A0A6A8DFW1_9BACI|nr:hypothetical protein [Aquibacillus halophilus]MRH41747.1 hypothetical protein [Aquibacillus halophilus]
MNKETVIYIANNLNKTNCTWAIGGSLLLFQHGITNIVNDLDIIVKDDDVKTVVNILCKLGKERKVEPLNPFHTTYYYEFVIKDLFMDVMSEFKIKHDEGVYVLPFAEHSVKSYMVDGNQTPFCLLEDWYILYQLIPGREEKVQKVENHFRKVGIENPAILKQALKSNLPKNVKTRIQKLLTYVSEI